MGVKVTKAQYAGMEKSIANLQMQLKQAIAERDRAKSSDGDRSENSALDAAEREITAVQILLDKHTRQFRTAEVVEDVDTSSINVLTQALLLNEMGDKAWYSIVDDGQGEPPSKVSAKSKMGCALIGSKVGDKVTFQDNRFRTKTFTVLEIREDQ